MGEQLFLIPIFLSAWGTTYYGEWITLTAFLGTLALSDMGVGTAGASRFVLEYSGGRKAVAATTAAATLVAVTLVCSAIAVFAIFIILGAWGSGYLVNDIFPTTELVGALLLLIGARLPAFYIPVFIGFWTAIGRPATAMNLLTGMAATKVALTVLVLLMGGRIISVAAIDFIVSNVFLLFLFFGSLRVVRDIHLRLQNVALLDIKELLKKGFSFFLMPLWQGLFFQGSILVVRAVLGAEAVVTFNTARIFTRSIAQFFSMIYMTILPEFQVQYGAGNLGMARRLFRSAQGIGLVAAFFAVAILWFVGPNLYQLWTHGELDVSSWTWMFLLIGILFNAAWSIATMVPIAANKPEGIAQGGVISAVISLGLIGVLSEPYGIAGAAAGMLVLEVVMTFLVLQISCQILGQSIRTLIPDLIADARASVGQGLVWAKSRR